MLKFLHLYKTLFFISLFTFFSVAEIQAKNVILLEDYALFRVENEVTLYSDIKAIYEKLYLLRCLSAKSPLLKAFGWGRKSAKTLPIVKKGSFSTPNERKFFDNLITLKKLSIFIGTKRFFKDEKFVLKYKKNKCHSKHKSVKEADISQLMVVDSYIDERFFRKNALFEKVEFEKFRKKFPGKSKNSLKKMFSQEDQDRRVESLELFIKSLNRKISHQLFL
jgi:hypothetical protein